MRDEAAQSSCADRDWDQEGKGQASRMSLIRLWEQETWRMSMWKVLREAAGGELILMEMHHQVQRIVYVHEGVRAGYQLSSVNVWATGLEKNINLEYI